MKIDNAIETFIKKYDNEAIKSIDEVANDKNLKLTDQKIGVFNLKEGVDNFEKYLEGYCGYKIDNISNEKATPHKMICERTISYIGELFSPKEVPYSDLTDFVKSYTEGIKSLIGTIDSIKSKMIESDVPSDEIGCINEFADVFMDTLDKSFYEAMDRILWASGYNAHKALSNINPSSKKKPIFL